MYKFIFISSLALTILNAVTIDDLVESTFNKNSDIKSIEKSIHIANQQILIAKNWENPMIAFKTNEIMFDKPLSNQKEYGVEISQVIPIGNKLDIEERIAKKDKNIQIFSLEDKKLELESKIYEYSYNILILEKKYTLLENYQKNLEKLEELNTLLNKFKKGSFNEILETRISTLDLKLEKENLKNKIRNLYLNLEQLTYMKIDSIDDKLEIKNFNKEQIEKSLIYHPIVKTLEENGSKYKEIASLEEAKKFSNVTLSLEYMQNKEQDYANITMSMPLPIYNTENINKLKANLNTNETNNKLDSQIHNLKLQTKIYLNNLEQYKTNYKILQEKIVPIKQKIQKVLEEFVGFDKESFKENLNSLNELIDYEMKASEQLEKYFENYSELIYYSNKGLK